MAKMPDLNSPILTPIGSIVNWHLPLAKIPTGWRLCDGSNGTPNLIAKFIRGVATTPGTTGGTDTVTLTTSQIPAHSHTITSSAHTHITNTGNTLGGSGFGTGLFATSFMSMSSETVDFTLNNSGGGNPHQNLPKFFELAFIQRYY